MKSKIKRTKKEFDKAGIRKMTINRKNWTHTKKKIVTVVSHIEIINENYKFLEELGLHIEEYFEVKPDVGT